METLNWKPEKLRFQNAIFDAWVARSPTDKLLELEAETLRAALLMNASVVLRQPPAPSFEALLPDKELWKIWGLGSFNSIRFAKAVFSSPDDKYFLEGIRVTNPG